MLHSETVLVGPFELYFHSVVCYYVKIKLCYLSRTFLCTNQQNSFSYKKLLVFSQFWGGLPKLQKLLRNVLYKGCYYARLCVTFDGYGVSQRLSATALKKKRVDFYHV
jgi:hypothetical protein